MFFYRTWKWHREVDQKISMHAVYVDGENSDTVCVVADDTDIQLSLINISHHIRSHLLFLQGKTKYKNEVNYHDLHAIAVHLGKEICQILPCFHTSQVRISLTHSSVVQILRLSKKYWKHQNPTNFC